MAEPQLDRSMRLKFPAAYASAIVDKIVERLEANDVRGLIIDPFAGPGLSLHRLDGPGRQVLGFEIELPNVLAGDRRYVREGDSTQLRKALGRRKVKAFVTSPTYGNRFADHHNAADQSQRRSYTHDIREMTGDDEYELDDNNTGRHHFGETYCALHEAVWRECALAAADGCLFLLNVKNFVRRFDVVNVARWHERTLIDLGWERRHRYTIKTPGMRYGENSEARVAGEYLYEFVKV